MAANPFHADRYRWREVVGDPAGPYKIRHDYTILGFDVAAGTLDMLVRWAGDGGHCPIHRHVSTTTVMVLEGEQHLIDLNADGSHGTSKLRRAGDYALTVGDTLPHLEFGGPEGGIAFLGNHCADGLRYQLYDDDMNAAVDVTIESLVADWRENS